MSPSSLRKMLDGKRFSYNTDEYPFRERLEMLFGCRLESLHAHLGSFPAFSREKDQSTLAHRVFYANFSNSISKIYERFLIEIIKPVVCEPFYYQVIPTFRVGLPGNRFVGEFHKDTQYRHKSYEINFNLGLANYIGQCSLKAYKADDATQYDLLECPYGEVFSFDHIDRLHGSDINETGKTMVSIDFRLALKALYSFDELAKSVNTGTELKPGSYFSLSAI